jgi:PAS domain S-box-containing protein
MTESGTGSALDALRALAGPLFDAVTSSGVAITVTDPRLDDDPIIYANSAFEDLTGFATKEVLGRNCRFLQTDGSDPAVVKSIASALSRHEAVTVDVLNQRRDGTRFWNRLNITTIRDAEGAPAYRFATQADVTSEYADEAVAAQLKISRQKLVEANERLRVAQSIAGAAGAWEWDSIPWRRLKVCRPPPSSRRCIPTTACG